MIVRFFRATAFLAAVVGVGMVGCGPAPVNSSKTFSFDADALTAAAFKALDKNNDGQLDQAELASSPALKSAVSAIDSNKDRKITKSELQARFAAIAQKPGAVTVSATISMRGQPLKQTEVKLVPESWMGDLKSATGRTDDRGYVEFKEEGGTQIGIAPGYYRLALEKSNLGCEVYEDPRAGMPMLMFDVP